MLGTLDTYFLDLPIGTVPMENQVAGHTFQPGTNDIGLLRNQEGCVLKPATKPICGVREIKFYERVKTSSDPTIQMLRDLVPEYHGTVKISIANNPIEFIKLSDITHGMHDPCIMDVKIGRRTWDPLATPEKIKAEEQKYYECKQNLGLCIPGFQVYKINGDTINRYSKDYGKNLTVDTIKDALRIFLNADSGLFRPLIMQLLSKLWSIQKWARTQKSIRLYSSSVLLVYDARHLRIKLEAKKRNASSSSNNLNAFIPKTPTTPSSSESLNGKTSPFKWNIPPTQQKENGNTMATTPTSPGGTPKVSEPIQFYCKLQKSHSFTNNYDEDLKDIRENYAYMLDNLIGTYNNVHKEWANVKMIDFAHVFPGEDETNVDTNYLFGIENLVKLFEELLKECD